MRFALLAYSNIDAREQRTEPEQRRIEAGIAEVLARPNVTGWLRLQNVESATTVRHEQGRTLLTDGPFVDSKDYLGGFILVEAENLDGALADLDEALRRKPVADTLVLRGEVYLHKDAADKAIRDFTEAIRMEPRNAVAFYLRGFAYQARGEDARARDDFKEAARIDPDVAKRFQ